MNIRYFIFQTRLQNVTEFVGRLILNRCYNEDRLIDPYCLPWTRSPYADFLIA